MSATSEYYAHLRTRYAMSAPVKEKIRWHQTKIALLRKYAAEVPSEAKWAKDEISGEESFISDLRNGNA